MRIKEKLFWFMFIFATFLNFTSYEILSEIILAVLLALFVINFLSKEMVQCNPLKTLLGEKGR